LLPAAAVMLVAGSIASWGAIARGEHKGGAHTLLLSNPVEVKEVIRVALFLGAVLILTKLASGGFGNGGVLALAAVTGAGDVDPFTVAATKIANGGAPLLAAAGVLIAVISNSTVKVAISFVAGGKSFGLRVLAFTAAALAIGGLGLAVVAGLRA
jgi:uncharacterized membrane protein (DUF4010 family)